MRVDEWSRLSDVNKTNSSLLIFDVGYERDCASPSTVKTSEDISLLKVTFL